MSMFRAGSQSRRGLADRLLERDWELAAIERALSTARAGTGAVVFIEGEPGSGKSRLLSAGADSAAQTGTRVLRARAAELERDFPFGLAIQLFEPLWLSADAERRTSLARGPARRAVALFDGSIADAAAEESAHYAIIHGLFSMLRQLAALRAEEATGSDPTALAIFIDDAHWSDGPSVRFLAYLTERIVPLPLAIVLTAQQGEVGAEPKALASLRRAAQGSVLRVGPLSVASVTTIVRRQFPEADGAFCQACARISGGNPFLLLEVLGKLREEERSPEVASTEGLADILPGKVTAAMAARLDAMPRPARALACAVAVLDGTSLRLGAAVAGIDATEAARAADVLAGAGLLHPGVPLSFVHPLLREAVIATLSPLERSHLHGRAARELADEGADAERVATHLLEAPPAQDDEAFVALLEAATNALAAGRADQAAALLDRAMAGQPSEAVRIGLGLARSDVLSAEGRHAEAAELLHVELAGSTVQDEEVAGELDAAYVSAASLVPDAHRASRPVRERMLAGLPAAPSQRQRRALARSLVYESLLGLPGAEVRRLAELAWGDGKLLSDHAAGECTGTLLCASLLFVDELERVVEISRALPPGTGVRSCRAWALANRGALAEVAAEETVALALCHLERGELGQADAVLDRVAPALAPAPIGTALVFELRARLRLAQHRPEEALREVAAAAAELQGETDAPSPGAVPIRSTAALVHLALGQAEQARQLAEEELKQAQLVEAPRPVIRALRVLGLATGGAGGIELLTQAVELGAASPPRLEYIHALVDLGAALRRTNRRSDAREPLRLGLELAEQGDVLALVRRARTELLATSSRPDLLTLSGPESLTASQRRVAELAVRGLTTREIAEALFVRPKTVEFHLRQIYRKLDITSRDQLAAALTTELPNQPQEGER